MVPVEQREQEEKSLASNPRFEPQNMMVIFRLLDILPPPCWRYDAG